MELEVEEGPRVLGIGVGLFLLILLWSFTIIGTLLCSRLSSGGVTVIVSMASLITVLLLATPRDPPVFVPKDKTLEDEKVTKSIEDFIIYDQTFIPRIVLIVFLGLTVVGVGSYTLIKSFSQQVYAEVVITKKYN